MFFPEQRGSDFEPAVPPEKQLTRLPLVMTMSPAVSSSSPAGESSDSSAPAVGPPPGALRIATYNIHKGVSGFSLRNRIHDLRAGVQKINADIMF